jgi:hypothetical protein
MTSLLAIIFLVLIGTLADAIASLWTGIGGKQRGREIVFENKVIGEHIGDEVPF